MASNTDTRRLRVVITGDASGATTALDAVGTHAKKQDSMLGGFADTVGKWAKRGTIAIGAVGFAAGAMGLKTASGLEQAQIGFKTMLGSADRAQKFLKNLQDFANKTPFEFPELVGAAQRLLAMGFAADKITPMLTSVGDAVAAMGGGQEAIDSITRALGQMQQKGKVSAEELMQLSEQGIPALRILADAYGVSTAKMSDMITKGQVMADKAIPALITGLENGTKNVQGFGGMMAQQSTTMAGKWSTFMDTMKSGLGNMVSITLPMLKSFVDDATKFFNDLFAGLQGKGRLEGFTGQVVEIGAGLRELFKAMRSGKTESDALVGAFGTVGVKIHEIAEGFRDFVLAIVDVIVWLKEHKLVAYGLIGTLTTLIMLTKAYGIALKVEAAGGLAKMTKDFFLASTAGRTFAAAQWAVNGAVAAGQYLQIAGYLALLEIRTKLIALATKVWAGVQWLLNAALNANPIGLVIIAIAALVGIFILAYKHSETFRNIVDGTFRVIKAVATDVADWFMAHIWPVMKAVFDGIAYGLLFLYNAVWKPIWILMQIAVKLVIAYFQTFVWPIWKDIFTLIANIVSWLYNVYIKPYFSLIQWIIGGVVNFIANVAWPKLKTAFNIASVWATTLWDQLRRIFDSIQNKIDSVLKAIVRAFQVGRDGVVAAWNAIADAAKKPVNFVIGTVYNDHIRVLFNKLAEKFGVKTRLDYIATLASGGVMPGYAPKKDSILAMLSPGEGVLVPEAVKQLGADRVLAWNRAARAGMDIAKYQDGGVVGFLRAVTDKSKDFIQGIATPVIKPLIDAIRRVVNSGLSEDGFAGLLRGGTNNFLTSLLNWVTGKDKEIPQMVSLSGLPWDRNMSWQIQMALLRRAFPGLELISGFRPGARTLSGSVSYHALGRAVDVPPRMDVFNWIASVFGSRTRELIFSPAGYRQIWNGQPHMYTGAVRGQHWDHVHWAMDSGGVIPPYTTATVTNATSRREFALTEDKLKGMGGGVTIQGDVIINTKATATNELVREIRDKLMKLGGRNGGTTGIT